MSDIPESSVESPATPTSDDEGQIPGSFGTYADLAEIIQAEVKKALEVSKVNNILVGWVTGFNPLTVRLLDGEDVQPKVQADGFVLELDDKVGLKHTVNGYIITEKVITITNAGELGMVPVGGVIFWPRNTLPPAGWYVADGQNGTDDLRGTFLIGAGVNGFNYNDSGGTDQHNHTISGSTNSAGSHNHSVSGSSSSAGSHSHGGQTGQAPIPGTRSPGSQGANYGIHQHPISGDGGHSHGSGGYSTGTQSSHTHGGSYSSSNKDHLPYYKTHHWIQYLGV